MIVGKTGGLVEIGESLAGVTVGGATYPGYPHHPDNPPEQGWVGQTEPLLRTGLFVLCGSVLCGSEFAADGRFPGIGSNSNQLSRGRNLLRGPSQPVSVSLQRLLSGRGWGCLTAPGGF